MPHGERQVDSGGHHERSDDHPDRRQIVQHVADEVGTERIPDRHQHDGDHRTDVGQVEIQPHQGRNATEPDRQPDNPAPGEPVVPRHGQQHGGEQRDHRDQQPGRRAGQPGLGVAEEPPRTDDLHRGVEEQPPPATEHRGEGAAVQCDREKQQGAKERPTEGDHDRVENLDRDPDQQIRDAPEQGERGEEHPATATHLRPPPRDRRGSRARGRLPTVREAASNLAVVLAPAHDSGAGRQSADRPIRCRIHGQQPAFPMILRPLRAAGRRPNVVDGANHTSEISSAHGVSRPRQGYH